MSARTSCIKGETTYRRGDEIVICLVKVYIKEQGLSFSIANVHNLSILFGHDLLNFFETIF